METPANPKAPQQRQIFWISVEDHLPEVNYHVLLQDKFDFIWLGYRDGCCNTNWHRDDGLTIHFITHWAVLPNPAE